MKHAFCCDSTYSMYVLWLLPQSMQSTDSDITSNLKVGESLFAASLNAVLAAEVAYKRFHLSIVLSA